MCMRLCQLLRCRLKNLSSRLTRTNLCGSWWKTFRRPINCTMKKTGPDRRGDVSFSGPLLELNLVTCANDRCSQSVWSNPALATTHAFCAAVSSSRGASESKNGCQRAQYSRPGHKHLRHLQQLVPVRVKKENPSTEKSRF